MRTISYREPLVFYDGLQVFVAEDQFGTKHICTLVEQSLEADKYLCVPVSLARLHALIQGTLDLRQVYARPEIDELSIVLSEGGALENLFSSPIQSTEIPERWLPQGSRPAGHTRRKARTRRGNELRRAVR